MRVWSLRFRVEGFRVSGLRVEEHQARDPRDLKLRCGDLEKGIQTPMARGRSTKSSQ